jgi:hypothetical protein
MLNDAALALYEGTRETDLVDESIDERILKLLGLDDVFDIDYGTYVSLLKERLVASRNFNKKLSTEEDELLVEEFRKVKGKVGRFKIRKKKITAENLGVTGPVRVSKERFYLTSKAVVPQPAAPVAESSEDVKNISDSLDSILKSLTEQNKLTKKKAEEDRKSDEQSRRLKRESELEKPLKKALGVVKTLIAPFQNILDRIMRFIRFTLLGFLVDKVLKWFTDPENERKIKILGRFLKDWWPSLAFAAGLFLTPLGKFVRTTLTMLRTFVPQMVRFMAAHPLVFGAAAAGVGAYAASQMNEKRRAEFKKTDPSIVLPEETAKTGKTPGAPQLQQEQVLQRGFGGMFNGGGQIKRRSFFGGGAIDKIVDVNDIAFNEGGGVNDDSGVRITGAGPDTQLIAAQPGEVVISKKAVDKYGANFFLGLNKRAGGTNIPRMVNNIQLAQGGGLIGALGRFLPGTGRVMAPKGMELGYQNKLLGINIGGVNKLPLNQTYSPAAAQRYNTSPTATSRLERFETGPLSGRHVSIPKTTLSKPTSPVVPKTQRSSGMNLNLKQNVETIQGAAKRQEQMMRELGVEPSGYVNLRGQPINLGPQSRAMPVGTPNIISRSQTIVLPPQTIASQKPSVPVKTGTQIPDVQTVARIPHREMVIQSLGIGDLMGVG